MGRLALLRYSEDQNLTFFRKSICDTIIEYELSQSLNSNFPLTINNDKYIELANSVVELFKSEKRELYHEPAYSSQRTVNGKKIIERKNATGLFHNSNERLRDFLRKSNVVKVVNVLRQDNTSIQE
ncbi:uncharacterized protein LOC116416161 [Nasonia vitripennis]|uniref:Uncharacterized protein n=1 Tax=Nasonia vitripennis TaxID=7425 RepID=A0A7M7QSQ5_NASVI|nr:uncharacterized protein LOC116416161 [Nasonia vitripennis]